MKGSQKEQLKNLRSSKKYKNASAYTILYDLIDSGIDRSEINMLLDEIEKERKNEK